MQRILITGGCGFIGTNAALSFAAQGHQVTIVDNFSRGGSLENRIVLHGAGITDIIELDIVTAPEALTALVQERGITAIIHAAAQVAVTTSVTDPMDDFRINALGTMHVLEAARNQTEPPLVLFTSTNKVYGSMEEVPVTEEATRYRYTEMTEGVPETLSLDFHSPYGCSKGSADQYTHDYGRIYGFPTTVFRQSCIYGKHQFGIVDQGWLAYLTMLAEFDKPITVYGDGKQVRDVLYVDDLVQAMEKAIEHPDQVQGRIFNMGGGPQNTLSLNEFLTYLEKKLGKTLTVRYADWRPGDQKVYVSDVRRVKERLGWEPTTSFEQGFAQMHAWIIENREMIERYL